MKTVSIYLKVLLATFLCLCVGVAFAQADPVSYDDFVAFLLQSVGGMKGAGAMAIVAGVVQIVLKLVQTSAGELLGKWKLLAVSLLTLVGGVIGLKVAGVDWGASFLHATTLAAVQVFIHQIYKQFVTKNE